MVITGLDRTELPSFSTEKSGLKGGGGGNNGTNNSWNPKSKARKIFKIALIGTSAGDAFLKNKNVKNRDFRHKKNREKNETFRKKKTRKKRKNDVFKKNEKNRDFFLNL